MTITPDISQRIYNCYKTHRKEMKNTLCKRRGSTIITAAEQRQRARVHVLETMKDDLFYATGILLDHRIIKDVVTAHEEQRRAAYAAR